jgi:beta-ketodecanoyl-[acyl-carrier-protein] synthase
MTSAYNQARPVISSTGLFTPADSISNEELVASFNEYVAQHNAQHAAAIEAGEMVALQPSSVEFIEKASGIKARKVLSKASILDTDIMCPRFEERPNDQISVLAEIGVAAARDALERAGRDAKDVDAVLVACSNLQRAYPAIAIEVQDALGIEGFGFDMNVACSSATFGIQTAADFIRCWWSARKSARAISTGATATAISSSATSRPPYWSRRPISRPSGTGIYWARSSRRASPTTSATISVS